MNTTIASKYALAPEKWQLEAFSEWVGGHAYPCAFLREPPFLAGNIRKAALKTM